MSARQTPDMSHELRLIGLGARLVAGVDEAGRGPLAGPVVAAAVIFEDAVIPDGIADSKTLSATKRRRLHDEIRAVARVGVGVASHLEIDGINILQATFLAMHRAVEALGVVPCHVLVDGNRVPKSLASKATAIVKGDALCISIAAASVIAKTVRDEMMDELCATYPEYGFSKHMGYGTKDHLDAIQRHGPCPVHRMSFRPLKPAVGDLLAI